MPTVRKGTISYQHALRDVAKSMVRLKRPERLLKMITRFIDSELGLSHTSLVVRDQARNRFTFVDSKGTGRFPISLLRFDLDHPFVLWFEKKKGTASKEQDYLLRSALEKGLLNVRLRMLHPEKRRDFERVKKAMDDLRVELAVPGYHKDHLVGILLLGSKRNRRAFTASEISFFQILAQDCAMAIKTAEYHQGLIEKNKELEHRLREIEHLRHKEHETYYQIMRALAREVDAKDTCTFGHISQVENLGLMTAEEMELNLSDRRRDILLAALILHDVGKIGIPDSILKKPAALTPEEWKVMKMHVDKGARILEPLTDFKEVSEIIRCHHEHFDGKGYPRGLKGAEIPVEARIVSVVDAYDTMISKRAYNFKRPPAEAFEELRRCAGTQFDPEVVEAFIRALQRKMKKRAEETVSAASGSRSEGS